MTFSKLLFSRFKKSVTRSVWGAPAHEDIINFETSCCNLEIKGLGAKLWISYCFNSERNYDILKSDNPCISSNKNINFNKNETKSKIENPTDSFIETSLVLQLI